MRLPLTLERVVKLAENDDALIMEIMKKAELQAMLKVGRIPTVTEVLYHQSEEELLNIEDILGNAFNERT